MYLKLEELYYFAAGQFAVQQCPSAVQHRPHTGQEAQAVLLCSETQLLGDVLHPHIGSVPAQRERGEVKKPLAD